MSRTVDDSIKYGPHRQQSTAHDSEPTPSPAAVHMSIADLIPQWYEGGSCEAMKDEAFAQIRLLERQAQRQRELLREAEPVLQSALKLFEADSRLWPAADKF